MNHSANAAPTAPAAGAQANDLPAFTAPQIGLYRHYKGGWYHVVGTARCSETLQGMALYQPLYGDGLEHASLWVRPAAMFLEVGDFGGNHQPRFALWQVVDVPLQDLPTARAVVAYLRSLAESRGMQLDLALRPPPPEPDSCCQRGCNGCVWEGYYAALACWREDALALLASAN